MSFINKIQEVVCSVHTRQDKVGPSCAIPKTTDFKFSDSPLVLRPLTFEEMNVRDCFLASGPFGATLARGSVVVAEAATIGTSTAAHSSFLAKLGVFGAGMVTGAGVAVATRSFTPPVPQDTHVFEQPVPDHLPGWVRSSLKEWLGVWAPEHLPSLVPDGQPLPAMPTIAEPAKFKPGKAPDTVVPGRGDPQTSPAAPLPRKRASDMTDLPPVMTPVASAGEDETGEPAPTAGSADDKNDVDDAKAGSASKSKSQRPRDLFLEAALVIVGMALGQPSEAYTDPKRIPQEVRAMAVLVAMILRYIREGHASLAGPNGKDLIVTTINLLDQHYPARSDKLGLIDRFLREVYGADIYYLLNIFVDSVRSHRISHDAGAIPFELAKKLAEKRDWVGADRLYNEAIEYYRSGSEQYRQHRLPIALLHHAKILFKLGEYRKAKQSVDEAKAILETLGLTPEEVGKLTGEEEIRAIENLAEIYDRILAQSTGYKTVEEMPEDEFFKATVRALRDAVGTAVLNDELIREGLGSSELNAAAADLKSARQKTVALVGLILGKFLEKLPDLARDVKFLVAIIDVLHAHDATVALGTPLDALYEALPPSLKSDPEVGGKIAELRVRDARHQLSSVLIPVKNLGQIRLNGDDREANQILKTADDALKRIIPLLMLYGRDDLVYELTHSEGLYGHGPAVYLMVYPHLLKAVGLGAHVAEVGVQTDDANHAGLVRLQRLLKEFDDFYLRLCDKAGQKVSMGPDSDRLVRRRGRAIDVLRMRVRRIIGELNDIDPELIHILMWRNEETAASNELFDDIRRVENPKRRRHRKGGSHLREVPPPSTPSDSQ